MNRHLNSTVWNPLAALAALLLMLYTVPARAAEPSCPLGSSPDPAVIWCDSFEDEDLGPGGTVGENYLEFDTDGGDHARINTEHMLGQYALRSRWQAGEVDAGHFFRTFGRNPLGSQSHDGQDFREIFWRVYVKLQDGFVGQPDKNSRATSFANRNWAQAMIAHLWAPGGVYMEIDPASGINAQNQLATTTWNDFANLTWLGKSPGHTTLTPGQWYCVEAHVKLNTPGQSDGVFEFWIDDQREAGRSNLNWVGSWTDYGINAVFFSDYWGATSPREQERYLDALVISTRRVGCLESGSRPSPPSELSVP